MKFIRIREDSTAKTKEAVNTIGKVGPERTVSRVSIALSLIFETLSEIPRLSLLVQKE
ncbi:MAG: hypothetical protein J6328_05785 [Bacilli bacterium]|nr:hypothetical protein [Bacilli bacterium]